MAKGGGKKRTYVRDGNGRFASTPGSAAKKAAKSTSGRKGTLGARTGLKGSRAKLKAKDKADQTLQNTLSTRAQKGAVKRGNRKLAAAKVAAQTRIGGGRKGVIGKSRGLKAKPALKPSLLAGAATILQQSLSKAKTKSDEAKARIAYKRIVRQELKNNPQNVLASNVPKQKRLPSQDSRMSKSKVRTVGNNKERVQKRAARKLYQAERALDRTLNMKARGLLVQASTYEKQLRSALKLRDASKYLKTGQLPRGNNSIAEKRKMADTMERLAQKNKQRARERAARESKMSEAVKPVKPPTRTKGGKASLPRTPGTVAKPKGLKPGALAARRARKEFPKSMRGKNVNQDAAWMAFMDRAQSLPNKRRSMNDYSNKRTAQSLATSAKAQKYISKYVGPNRSMYLDTANSAPSPQKARRRRSRKP